MTRVKSRGTEVCDIILNALVPIAIDTQKGHNEDLHTYQRRKRAPD